MLATLLLPLSAGIAAGMGLSVLDFGAKGDGVSDDGAALQKALDASQLQRRTLLFPAGDYLTSIELVVRCTEYAGGAKKRSPVRLLGEGHQATRILAAKTMRSVLHLNNTEEPTIPKPGGHSANGHEIEGISFDASGGKANYSLYAPATTRSAFRRLGFFGARLSGLFLGYGWINVITECKFNGNGFALHLENNINSVQVMNNIIENNRGVGIYVNGGTAVELSGNCIESAGGPAIMANGVSGLTVRGNYYEANNVAPAGTLVFVEESTGKPIELCTDLVLNGAPLASAIQLPNLTLGNTGGMTQAAIVSGNYYNPAHAAARCHDYAGVFAYSANGVVFEANHASGCYPNPKHKHAPKCTPLVAGPAVVNTSYRVELNTGVGFAL